jgi:hypothetical protein
MLGAPPLPMIGAAVVPPVAIIMELSAIGPDTVAGVES